MQVKCGGRAQRTWPPEKCGGAVSVLGRDAGSTWCALGRRFHLWHSRREGGRPRISDLKFCERIGPGSLTSFLHKIVAWNAWGFSWTHDPKQTNLPARNNSSRRSGTLLWHLVRNRCVTVLTVWTNKKHNNTLLWLARHCTLDKTDQKRNTQRKKQRESCRVPRVLRDVCSNVNASITASHPCSAGVYQIKK